MVPVAVRMRGIVKSFGSVPALRGADFTLAPGEVHALLGENGAGKTTLMNVLFGQVRQDAGTIEATGPIGMVHQHFSQVSRMTVAENVWLGRPGLRFDKSAAEAAVRRVGDETGLALDPGALAGNLPAGLRQRLEIIKALAREVRILILDEPTAALTPGEVRDLFAALGRLRQRGIAIVLITHKLREVGAIANRVTVLRRGAVILAGETPPFTLEALAAAMIGESAEASVMSTALERRAEPARNASATQNVLVVRIPDVSMEVRSGEIVGIAAVEGNGQRELMRAVAGLAAHEGEIHIAAGIAGFVPEDRQLEGLIQDFSIAENFGLIGSDGFWMSPREVRRQAGLVADEFDIRSGGVRHAARSLSGGNQQKLVLARELSRRPVLLVAENPTRGLDVRATAEVHQRLRGIARTAGTGVLFYSTDLDEVLALADRIGVMVGGRWQWVSEDARTREQVGAMMLGGAP